MVIDMAKNRTSAQESLTKTGLNLTDGLSFGVKPSAPAPTPSPQKEVVEEKSEPKKDVEPPAPAPKVEEKSEIKEDEILSFGIKKEKRTVRKQFLLEPSADEWLTKTAKKNGVSENEVFHHLITLAREGKLK